MIAISDERVGTPRQFDRLHLVNFTSVVISYPLRVKWLQILSMILRLSH